MTFSEEISMTLLYDKKIVLIVYYLSLLIHYLYNF